MGIKVSFKIMISIAIFFVLAISIYLYLFYANYIGMGSFGHIDIIVQNCPNGKDAVAVVHNVGTETITLSRDLRVWDEEGKIVDGTWTDVNINDWRDVSGTKPITVIKLGDYGRVTLDCCGDEGEPSCPRTCQFEIVIVVSGRAKIATIYCPGEQ